MRELPPVYRVARTVVLVYPLIRAVSIGLILAIAAMVMPASVRGDAVHLPVIRRDEWPTPPACEPLPNGRDAGEIVLRPGDLPDGYRISLADEGRIAVDGETRHSNAYTVYDDGFPYVQPAEFTTQAVVYCTHTGADGDWRNIVDYIDATILDVTGHIQFTNAVRIGDRTHTAYTRTGEQVYYGSAAQHDNTVTIVFVAGLYDVVTAVDVTTLLRQMESKTR